MKTLILSFLTFVSIATFAQNVKKYYYDSGQLLSEVTTDKDGLMIKYSSWDIYGNLLTSDVYADQYKHYPKRDFSKIQWSAVTNGVSIFKYNSIDTNIVIQDSNTVVLNYQCYFINGKMLDNSFARNCPLVMRLNDLVRGFTEGIKKMNPGETALIMIEPSMAYGDTISGNIPANSTLIYLVELISIE